MISLKNIQKTFNKGKANEVTAIADLNLEIQKGEFVVLIGPNGSGKTSLLNIIAGAEFPTIGAVRFDDADVTRLPEYRRSRWIARVFQNPLSGTAPELSILDNFRLAALRTSPKKLKIGINEAFANKVKEQIATLGMGLENKVEQPMGSLSGGQRQALTLLMTVMDNTEILLLDEPTAALDPRSARLILETAEKLISDHGLTTILITHNLKDAHQYGSRLIQMGEGKITRDLDHTAKSKLTMTDIYAWFN
jgi:putative tryptophan/tyrosine transport system ATP-binding protein